MALQTSGRISLADAKAELAMLPNARLSLNDIRYRTLVGKLTGRVSLRDAYGKADKITKNIAVSNTYDYVANTAKVPGYIAGKTIAIFTITGVIGSSSTSSHALDVDASWAAGDEVFIINNGYIVGRGGNGGFGGGDQGWMFQPGAAGGPALRAQRLTSITNNGTIGGGGGGGGGGSNGYVGVANKNGQGSTTYAATGGGGGGGAGQYGGGPGQNGDGPGNWFDVGGGGLFTGGSGSLVSGGGGGGGGGYGFYGLYGGSGGTGGALGQPGAIGNAGTNNGPGRDGGSAGRAITGNSNIIWTVPGIRLGSIIA